jgi:3-hydroxybutyryl-CoA dehydratase
MELMKSIPNDHNFYEISVGDVYSFNKSFSKEEVLEFGRLSGDLNPLHVGDPCEIGGYFNQNLVHGMLTASLFSTLIGMYCPGKNSLYLSQTLKFRKPVFTSDNLLVKGTVISKTDALQIITLKTEIIKEDQIVVYGEAMAKMLI